VGWPDKFEHIFTNHSKKFDVQCRAEYRLQTNLEFCFGYLFVLHEWAKSGEQTLGEFGCSSREEFFLEMLLFVNYPLMCSKVDISKR
jgi:hypothetical protein